jgi:hypothetical protein
MTVPSRLRAVPQLVGKTGFANRFQVAAQALVAGVQDIHVQAITPLSGPGKGQIGVRVGRLLVYVADKEALQSFLDAWRQAEALADKAFGPELPPPRIGSGQATDQG